MSEYGSLLRPIKAEALEFHAADYADALTLTGTINLLRRLIAFTERSMMICCDDQRSADCSVGSGVD